MTSVVGDAIMEVEKETEAKPKQFTTVSNDNPYLNRRVYSFTLHGCGGNVQIAKTETKDIMTNFDRKDFVSLKEIAEIVQIRVKEWMRNSGYLSTLKQQEDGKLAEEVVKKFNGKFIVRGGRQETKEGDEYSRNVVVEFPSYEIAISAYESEEYQQALKV